MEALTGPGDISPPARKALPGKALPRAPARDDELASAGPYRPRQAEAILGNVAENRLLPFQGAPRHVHRLEYQSPGTPYHPLTTVQRLKKRRVDIESGQDPGRRPSCHLSHPPCMRGLTRPHPR